MIKWKTASSELQSSWSLDRMLAIISTGNRWRSRLSSCAKCEPTKAADTRRSSANESSEREVLSK